MTARRTGSEHPSLRAAAASVAWTSGLLLAVAGAGMVYAALRTPPRPRYDPTPADMTRLDHLKRELKDRPDDERLREQFRRADLAYRRRTWQLDRFVTAGAWLAAAAAAGLLLGIIGCRAARPAGPSLPGPAQPPAAQKRGVVLSTRATLGAFAGIVGIAAAVAGTAWWLSRPVPRPPAPRIAVYWPSFRGANGSGATEIAVTLGGLEKTLQFDSYEEGWVARVLHAGKSSPVLWGNHLFITGGSGSTRMVMAYSAATGKPLWETKIPPPTDGGPSKRDLADTGYAAATPCTDGERVYAIFSGGTLAALDFRGRIAWTRQLGPLENTYGHASSLVMAGGRVIVQLDQAVGMDDDGNDIFKSKLLAINPASGETVWEAPRKVPDSWTSPIVVETGGQERIITVTNPWVIAYDPAAGTEVWRARALSGEVAPSPVCAAGRVYVTMEGAGTTAVRLGGRGDVTKTHVAWRCEKGPEPNTVSPAATEEYVFVSAGGKLGCIDAQTGQLLWERGFEGRSMNASPALVGGNNLLLIDTRGTMYLVARAPRFCEVGRFELGEGVDASPAFGADRIFIRGRRHLFCLRVANTATKDEQASKTK